MVLLLRQLLFGVAHCNVYISAAAAAAVAVLQEGRVYLDQLNSSIGRDTLLLREAAEAIEEVSQWQQQQQQQQQQLLRGERGIGVSYLKRWQTALQAG
jgi:hypothetical protein